MSTGPSSDDAVMGSRGLQVGLTRLHSEGTVKASPA